MLVVALVLCWTGLGGSYTKLHSETSVQDFICIIPTIQCRHSFPLWLYGHKGETVPGKEIGPVFHHDSSCHLCSFDPPQLPMGRG